MPSPVRFIAIDLGAESGRVIVATLAGGRIGLEVVHRFPNGPITVADADGESLRWDLPATFRHITDGLGKAFARHRDIAGIGVDTWGVDYGLLDAADRLVTLPFNYRDRRTQEPFAQLHGDIPEAEMFARTGVRPMAINTLYQLVAHQRRRPQDLERAACLLTIPDLLHFWLSGEKRSEWSIVGSTQLARAGLPEWDIALIARLGLPARLFQPDRPTRHGAGAAAAGAVRALRAGGGAGHRAARRPRHRQRGGRVARRPRRHRLPEQRHVVAGRARRVGAAPRRRRAGRRDQQRDRGRPGRRRHDPPQRQHHGPVAGAGVPARLRARAAASTAMASSPTWRTPPARAASCWTSTTRASCRPAPATTP